MGKNSPATPASCCLGVLLLLAVPSPAQCAVVSLRPTEALDRCADSLRIFRAEIEAIGDLQGYEAEIRLDESILALPGGFPYGIEEGDFLGDSTFFHVQRLEEGSYRITHTKLGAGGIGGAGVLFRLSGDPIAETPTASPLSLTRFEGRDRWNQPIDATVAPPALLRVDCSAPQVQAELAGAGCFRGESGADPVTVRVTASDTGGEGADLDRIEAQLVPGTGPCDPHGDWASALSGIEGTEIGPLDLPVPDPPAAGEWTVHLRAVDDAGNRSSCDGVVLLFLPDPPPPATDLTAVTRHRGVELEWRLPDLLPGQEVRIVRRTWNRDGTSGYPRFLPGGALDGGGYPAGIDDGATLLATTTETTFFDEVSPADSVPDIYLYRAFVIDCLAAVNPGEAPESIAEDFVEEETTDAADAACNYWLGDIDGALGPPLAQDGSVTAVDLAVLSGSFGRIDGEDGFVPEADFGPSAMPAGSPRGVPRPDGRVDFEDVILLASNYGAVGPLPDPLADPIVLGPAVGSSAAARLLLRLLPPIEAEGPWLAEVRLSVGERPLRGIRAVLIYPPDAVEVIGFGESDAVRMRRESVFTGRVGRTGAEEFCLVALGPGCAFKGAGPLCRFLLRPGLPFDPESIRLDGIRLRDDANQEVDRLEAAAIPLAAPAARAIAETGIRATPNPFRSQTEIRLALERSAPVTLAIHDPGGRRIRTIAEGIRDAGNHRFVWSGRDQAGRPVPPGVYFCDLQIGEVRTRTKIVRSP